MTIILSADASWVSRSLTHLVSPVVKTVLDAYVPFQYSSATETHMNHFLLGKSILGIVKPMQKIFGKRINIFQTSDVPSL